MARRAPVTPGWMSTLQIVFLVMCVLGGINLARPANNTAVLVFRLSMVVIGLIGSVALLILQLRHQRSAGRRDEDDEEDEDGRPRRARLRPE